MAALGPAMLRIAGELADGIIVGNAGLKTIASFLVPTVTQAASAAGRPAPRVVAGTYVSLTDDAASRKREIAMQYAEAVKLPSYRAALEREGVTDVGEIAIVGNEIEIERQVNRLEDAGATDLLAWPVGSAEDRARTVALLGSLARSSGPTRSAAA